MVLHIMQYYLLQCEQHIMSHGTWLRKMDHCIWLLTAKHYQLNHILFLYHSFSVSLSLTLTLSVYLDVCVRGLRQWCWNAVLALASLLLSPSVVSLCLFLLIQKEEKSNCVSHLMSLMWRTTLNKNHSTMQLKEWEIELLLIVLPPTVSHLFS